MVWTIFDNSCGTVHSHRSDAWRWTLAWPATSSSSQERKLGLLTILNTRPRAYSVSLPRYIYLYCVDSRSIDPQLRLWTGNLPLPSSPYAPFSLARRSIDSFTSLLPTCLLFRACSIQYCTLTSLEPLKLHCRFPGAIHIALWLRLGCSYCTACF